MKKVSLANASKSVAQYAAESEEIVLVTKGNRALAALVSLKGGSGNSGHPRNPR